MVVGVVAGHYIWTNTKTLKSTATANRFGAFHVSHSGGGYSFSYGGSVPGLPSSGSGGASSNGGSSSSTSNVSSAITGKVDPGLVDINTNLGYQDGAAAGTGMVVSSSGEIITNNHVIVGATTISATDLGNGKTYTAHVVGYDYGHDVAVLQLVDASGLKTVSFGDSSSLKVGQSIDTIGNAGGTGGTPSAATGQISALNQSLTAGDDLDGSSEHLTGMVKLNGDLEPGDSGGPLVNSSGDVVGMDTAALSSYEFGSSSGQGFAIPIDAVKTIASEIVAGQSGDTLHIGATPFLGVDIESSTSGSSATGVEVQEAIAGEPAAAAGLAPDDVITAIDGTSVSSPSALTDQILQHQPGDTIQISYQTTSGSRHTASITLASGPPQ